MGAKDNIKFPTLEVRDPNELAFGRPNPNSIFPVAGPVYKETQEIKEKIRQINEALVEEKIEEEAEKLKEFIQPEEIETEKLAEEIDMLTDIAAAEIVAEEMLEGIEKMVNVKIPVNNVVEAEAEIEQLAEELAEEVVLSELVEMEVENMDKVVTEIQKEAEENVKVNIIDDEDVSAVDTSKDPTMAPPEEAEEEGSGKLTKVDFGDITEVSH